MDSQRLSEAIQAIERLRVYHYHQERARRMATGTNNDGGPIVGLEADAYKVRSYLNALAENVELVQLASQERVYDG